MKITFLIYFIAGSLGILLQIFAVKIPTLKAKYKAANHDFKFSEYFKDDWSTILASFVSVAILIVGLDELLDLKPDLEKYVKWLFIFVGFTGSSIIQTALSVANKKIMQIIDIKTNIADGVQPPVNDSNKEGAKEIKNEKLL